MRNVSHLDVNALVSRVRDDRMGFFLDSDIDALAGHPDGRLYQVLVRAGGCRFTCAAQDVMHLTRCLKSGGDYVRDVSIIAS
mgnify:CR=1 FL=1